MPLSLPVVARGCVCALLCLSAALSAQQPVTVNLKGSAMRAPLDVPEGQNSVRLCGLTPGETYSVIAVGAVAGQAAVFELSPSAALAPEAGNVAGRSNTLRFKAPAACAELQLRASSSQPLTTIPLFLSVKCESCAEAGKWLEKFNQQVEAANLSVTPAVSATDLVTKTLIGGNCYQVSNISSGGSANSRGTFALGNSSINIANGMVLATTHLNVLPGPNNQKNANNGFNLTPDDADLATLTNGANQWDVSKIEFDFTPTASTVKFDFVFGSEEYCEYVGTQYNDVFGFFISGPGISGKLNLAKLPNGTPVTINSINHTTNSSYYVNNNIDFLYCPGQTAAAPNDCELDGWTKVLTAVANVIPCSTYHIKLAIADVSDDLYGSAVFLRANSFEAGGTVNAAPVYPTGGQTAYEGCQTAFMKFNRSNTANNSQPLTVNFTVSGSSTATPGLDYAPIAGPVVIPAGQNSVQVPVTVFNDQILEGQENILLLLDNACSCTQSTVELLIADKPPLSAELPDDDQWICEGTQLTLTPLVSGGVPPYAYQWNTGDTTATLTVGIPGIYQVVVTDACGDPAADSTVVFVYPQIKENRAITLCSGKSVTINGQTITGTGTVQDTLPGLNGQCDTILTYLITSLPTPARTDTVRFCAGSAVVLNGHTYNSPGTVQDTLPGLNGACDTAVTYILKQSPLETRAETITFCQGSSVTINGKVYTASGTALDTLPGVSGGCDIVTTYILKQLPLETRSETISFCQGSSVTINGKVYTSSGTALDTLPGVSGGCDIVVTYTLTVLPPLTRTRQVAFCPGELVTIGGGTYNQPGTVLDTVPGLNGGCDTIVTYTLSWLPEPARAETIIFCPGDAVVIDGQSYTQPGTVTVRVPATTGCDTIVQYTLKYRTPAPSKVAIACPGNIAVEAGAATAVSYSLPTASSDCPCPGIALSLQSGLPSGGTFPIGKTAVCYAATDSCGNSASCCFNVTVSETQPCDIKVIGCVKYELLSITKDAEENKTFRIRVTNSCANKLIYTAFQLPEGKTALKPVENSVYTAPSGRQYQVRNPNYSPFYSLRYSAIGNGISNGASDIFEYTIPPQLKPTYIHVTTKLAVQDFYEAHLNTFYCPIGITPNQRSGQAPVLSPGLSVFPNPTTGALFADLSAWEGRSLELRVLDSRGQLQKQFTLTAEPGPQAIPLPETLANGLYFLQVLGPDGERAVVRFVVER